MSKYPRSIDSLREIADHVAAIIDAIESGGKREHIANLMVNDVDLAECNRIIGEINGSIYAEITKARKH